MPRRYSKTGITVPSGTTEYKRQYAEKRRRERGVNPRRKGTDHQKHQQLISDWKRKYPERHAAHAAVKRAVDKGTLVKPTRCESCGAKRELHGHHDDYNKPLDVQWLCVSCHNTLHRKGENNRNDED